MTRAVVFDLFETLVDYDDRRSREFSAAVAAVCGRDPEEFHGIWVEGRPTRDTGPMAPYLATLGIDGAALDGLLERRRESTRKILAQPRPGAIETLEELHRRGILAGLITVCSEDVVDVWAETPFAGLFDAEVFSSACGLRKPDPRIYRLALDALRVVPGEAVFVGDGAHDELAGAEAVGMRAVQIGDAQPWSGERIETIPEVLGLV